MNNTLILPKSQSPQMFDKIAKRYDFLNRLLSFGQDIRWRQKLADFVPNDRPIELLDLATGTADVLISLALRNANIFRGVGVDPSVEMLRIGQQKVDALKLNDRLLLQSGDAQKLVFLDNSVDVVTISFGIRNVPDLRLAMLEIYRVLKPGGKYIVLEFSKPANPLLAAGHWVYMNTCVPLIGFMFSGNFKAYQYLNQTIQHFPYAQRFCKIMRQFGFVDIHAHPLMGGVATIYVGVKPAAV